MKPASIYSPQLHRDIPVKDVTACLEPKYMPAYTLDESDMIYNLDLEPGFYPASLSYSVTVLIRGRWWHPRRLHYDLQVSLDDYELAEEFLGVHV